jgi:hypothetical protein
LKSVTYYESNRPRQYYPDFIIVTRDPDGRDVMWLADGAGGSQYGGGALFANGGNGGNATSMATATGGTGNANAYSAAYGGAGGSGTPTNSFGHQYYAGGNGGNATSMAIATAFGGNRDCVKLRWCWAWWHRVLFCVLPDPSSPP